MDTHTGGGLLAGLKRSFGGGSFFITDFTGQGNGHVAFAPRFPGTIVPALLHPGQSLICRKETFLVAEKSIALELAWQRRIGSGFFGGDGFILQKVTGPGVVWLDLSGELVERDLGAGERLLVHAGHVGVFEPSVSFDIQMVRGFRNILFGGEGLFLATSPAPATSGCKACRSSTSPRRSPAICRTAATPARTPPSGTSPSASALGVAGGILGGLFGGSNSDNNT